jgi:hypothetical protein
MQAENSRAKLLTQTSLRLTALAVLSLAAGCSASSTALTQEEFVKQGNAICAASDARIATEIAGLGLTQAPAGATAEALYGKLTGETAGIIEGLRALTPPSELQADYTALIAEADAVMAKVKAEGHEAYFARTEDPLAEVNAKSVKMGLTACGEGQ